MSDNWLISMDVWPFSTGAGADKDQKAAGDRLQVISVQAEDIGNALKLGNLFAKGIKTNPSVWQVRIKKIEIQGG
jgi:hypothetical protein